MFDWEPRLGLEIPNILTSQMHALHNHGMMALLMHC
jgi:hypothetical protein